MSTSTIQENITPSPNLKYRPKHIPIETIAYYVIDKQLTDSEIAKILNCERSNITKRRLDAGLYSADLKRFKDNRAEILAGLQSRVVNQLTDAKLEKASAYQLIGMLALLFDKERAERGKDIQALVGLAEVLGSLHKLRKVVEDTNKQGSNEPDIIDVTPLNE